MVKFLVIALAIWRLSSLLAEEYGPFDIFEKFRTLIGVVYDEHSARYGTNVIAKGVVCVWCNSVWFSALGALLVADTVLWWVIDVFALSALAIIIDSIVRSDG